MAYSRLHQDQRALEEYNEAIRQFPESSSAYLARARLWEEDLGRPDKAAADRAKAKELKKKVAAQK